MSSNAFDLWFPWYPDRFKKKTMHLSLIQRSIYRELIDFYMETRGALPNSDQALARIVGISVEEFTPHADLIRSFFKVKKQGKNEVLFHPTCEGILRDQHDRYENRKKKAQKAGKKSAEKRKEKQGQSNSELAPSSTNVQLNSTTKQNITKQDKKVENRYRSNTGIPEPTVPKTTTPKPPRPENTPAPASRPEVGGGGNPGGEGGESVRDKLRKKYPMPEPIPGTVGKPDLSFDIAPHLDAFARGQIETLMPGWNPSAVIERYNEWVDSTGDTPRSPKAAFLGWLKKQPKNP